MRKGIIQWSPFGEMDDFFENEYNNGADFTPPVDVYQEGENVVVKTPIADIDKEDIDISIEDNMLTISGKTSSKSWRGTRPAVQTVVQSSAGDATVFCLGVPAHDGFVLWHHVPLFASLPLRVV